VSQTRPVVSTVVLALLSGCATFSFKPGAGPDRMATDEHSCGQAGSEGFEDCMRNLGWYISDGTVGSPPLPAGATPITVAEAEAAPTAAAAVPAAPKATVASVPVVATPAAHVTAVPTPTAVPAAAAPPPTAPAPAVVPAASLPSSVPGSEELPKVQIGSWWKLGGSAAGLDSSIKACVAKLGAPHQPTPSATVVTIAMRDCLRADGWYPYNEINVEYVPPQR
jgi:hypothetical protein